jgi:hypothetical protein
MLLSLVAVACGAVALSTFGSYAMDINKLAAAREAERLREELKNYVTADLSVTHNAPGSPPWHLPDDTSCAGCWALAEGQHYLSRAPLSKMLTSGPAQLSYTVTLFNWQGREIRQAAIAVSWTE